MPPSPMYSSWNGYLHVAPQTLSIMPFFLEAMLSNLTVTLGPCFPILPPYITSSNNPQQASPLLPPLVTFSQSGTSRKQSELWVTTKQRMKKAFKPNSWRMVFNLLSPKLLIYSIMWFALTSPFPGQDTLFIWSTNQGAVQTPTTTRLSWWAIPSLRFTPQSYTNGYRRS